MATDETARAMVVKPRLTLAERGAFRLRAAMQGRSLAGHVAYLIRQDLKGSSK